MAEQCRVKVVEANASEHCFCTLAGKNVYQVLEMMGLDGGGSCAGKGNCGKCKVRVHGAISDMEAEEQEYLMPEEIKQGLRLACYSVVKGDITVYLDIMPTGHDAKSRVLKYKPNSPGHSGVDYKHIFIPGRLNDQAIPLYDRIQTALPEYILNLSPGNLNELNKIDRPGRPTLELYAVLFGRQEIRLVEREPGGLYGLALDLGTTSLYAALLDLETGAVLAMASQTNMQRIYGEDIISRITYAQKNNEAATALHTVLINNLNAMIDDILEESGLPAHRIFKISAVGNPVMIHFLLGLDVSGFGTAPFAGLFSSGFNIKAVDLGLNASTLAVLQILPQLGGFVGADTTGCLLTLPNRWQSTFLLIDIGTNGEIVLGHKGQLWASSAAAGPAFEGGALSSGMRAGAGAIERFYIRDDKIEFTTIGAGRARGICGSGIIDLLAVLLATGCINQEGNFTPQAASYFPMQEGSRGQEIVIISADETLTGAPVVLNQEDIRQVQLAKSAIRTAIDIMLGQARLKPADLEHIYFAGAFGSYLDAENLIRIGLLPPIDSNQVRNIGNAAAQGAILALMSTDSINEASKLKNKVAYIELADQTDFQDAFLNNLSLSQGDGSFDSSL